jgi:hypothetical protein
MLWNLLNEISLELGIWFWDFRGFLPRLYGLNVIGTTRLHSRPGSERHS